MRRTLPVLVSLVLIAPAWAHHSVAEYDRSILHELEGVLVEVRWRNPHIRFMLRVTSSNGEVEDWELQAAPPYPLERAGLVENMFSIDDHVRVAGWRSTRRPLLMNLSNLLRPSGEEILFSPVSENRWSDDSVGGRWLSEPDNGDRRGIYRIWSVAEFSAYQRAARGMEFLQTAAAQANTPDTPPLDPCVPQGIPGTMLTPLPIQFIDRGDHIDLQLTTFGVLRRINTTFQANLEAVPLSDLGYSAGTWVGDTLEVRTTRVGWPYIDDTGRPQTENVEILERFALRDDESRLTYTQTVSDPQSLIEPMTVSWDFIDIGEARIEPLHCE